ncbi:single-stranded DNA-binding protein [Mycoplasma sp. Ms02]|uniref:single-stranded DNA-binding protein n=1 Tax=Mycoplasma sp. Ms02 TaxID=353851 RepID=UPI001C8A3D9D|nr:single-stranded DNA-binding protein [Mycoplasma sp. Ms02]QZE12505.1 single-stranded DNA-binding protein [Mycoplasma sp. Ms02]
MNRVSLVGRISNEIRYNKTPSGIDYVRFTVAVRRNVPNSTTNNADFIPVVAWRQEAKYINDYALKGALVAIEGRISVSTYQNDRQELVTSVEVLSERFTLLESKAVMDQRRQTAGVASSNSYNNSYAKQASYTSVVEDNAKEIFGPFPKPTFGVQESVSENKNLNDSTSKSEENDYFVHIDDEF